jgi:hypothetical protein
VLQTLYYITGASVFVPITLSRDNPLSPYWGNYHVVHHTRPTDLRYYVAFALDRLVDSLLMGPSGALAMPQGNLLLLGLYICHGRSHIW